MLNITKKLKTTALLALVAVPASMQATEHDPLDRVYNYSLQLTPEGPKEGYFPIGLRPGMPQLGVHTGFNVWQPVPTFTGFKRGQAFSPLPEAEESELYGYQLYTQVRANLALRRGNPTAPANFGPFGHIGVWKDAEGVERQGIADHFEPNFTRYLMSYVEEAGRVYGSETSKGGGKYTHMWGMDNEWEGVLEYSDNARQQYAEWLTEAYNSDVAELNEAWGTTHETLEKAFAVVPPGPDQYKERPGEFLDWHTFQSNFFTTRLAEMALALHNADPEKRPVVYKSTQQTLEYPHVNRRKVFNHEVFAEIARPASGGIYGINMYGSGDRQSYETNFVFNAIRTDDPTDDSVWGVMIPEMNNHSGPGHQWAQTYWRVLSNGLKAANLFTMGYEGAEGDYDTFGHVAPDGKPRDKLFYAARWAHAIHRMESFWRLSTPVPDAPKVALLMPRRDIILSERTDRRVSRWGYPSNERMFFYGWLRELGFWVDVIPYSKLTDSWLEQYDSLFLIGAEHLKESEAEVIRNYVNKGGILVADERPGFYDEHHRERQWLQDVLGFKVTRADKSLRHEILPERFRAKGRVAYEVTTAQEGLLGPDQRPLVAYNRFGDGKVIHFAFELGATLDRELTNVHVSDFQATGGETADGEPVYDADVLGISKWIGQFLAKTGLKGAVRPASEEDNQLGLLRIEPPFMDKHGNVALAVAQRGLRDILPATDPTELLLWLPDNNWQQVLWAPSEHAGLESVKISKEEDNWYRVSLPPVLNAGMLYFIVDHEPLISLPQLTSDSTSIDGHSPLYKRGESFEVKVELFNTTTDDLPAGNFRFLARSEWEVSPSEAETPSLAAGETHSAVFTVTIPEDAEPNWLHPIVTYWNDGEKDRSIMTTNIEVAEE